jgi:predicted dehydrogenase
VAPKKQPSRPANPLEGHRVPPGMDVKPADLDWNRYLGAVPWRAWDPSQYFNFRNYMDFNGGILTDKFVHWVDAVHMLIGQDGPVSADTAGGLYLAKDGRTVPDTLNVHLTYPGNWICTYSNTPQAGVAREGIEFCGSEGHLFINRTKYEFFPAARDATSVSVACKTDLVEEHVQNFLDCCASRRTPNGDVAVGHRSAQAAHLANLSYLEGRRIHFDPDRELVLPL